MLAQSTLSERKYAVHAHFDYESMSFSQTSRHNRFPRLKKSFICRLPKNVLYYLT